MNRNQSAMKESDSSHQNEDPVEKIVRDIKLKGIFDQFRKECLEDVDTKVCGYVQSYTSSYPSLFIL